MLRFIFVLLIIFTKLVNAYTLSEQTTEQYFETIKNNPKQLNIFLKTMPKGGDLHNHLGGASMAENMIRYAENDHLCLNKRTLSVQEQAFCDSAYRLKN